MPRLDVAVGASVMAACEAFGRLVDDARLLDYEHLADDLQRRDSGCLAVAAGREMDAAVRTAIAATPACTASAPVGMNTATMRRAPAEANRAPDR